MNREILFRGECIDETCLKGQWLEGYILHDGVTGKYYIHRDNYLNESDNVGEEGLLRFVAYEVDPETVCQYTGLTDKNGRKIFEGDILKRVLLPTKRIENNFRIAFVPVKSCFSAIDLDGSNVTFISDYINSSYEIEVIGNIFDNPELIGSTE